MIKIQTKVVKNQPNFWSGCVFHPTDAVEDAWGGRILDRMAEDGAINTVRVYAMLEDIVYLDEEGGLCYDFRTNDLRLDYLVECGYDLVIALAGIPSCISYSEYGSTTVAKGKTRYKGKMWNTNAPRDYSLWEEICYEYVKHITHRYGDRVVDRWRIHCFNEPDMPMFWLSGITDLQDKRRVEEYLKLYEAFVRGVRRASKDVRMGGPALAVLNSFLEQFLLGVKERGLEINYIALHFYGTDPEYLNSGEQTISVDFMKKRLESRLSVVRKCGFADTPIVIDEWGACSHGFYNIEECPQMIFRETEVYPAYFIRFIDELINIDANIEGLMICLSGQHEQVRDFSGFRNFFSLNFIAKPIYNAYVLTSKLHGKLLGAECECPDVNVIPTRSEEGEYAIALCYAGVNFEEDIPDRVEKIVIDEDISGKTVTVWCIDKNTANPYRVYQKMGVDVPSPDELRVLREEGRLKPVMEQSGSEPIRINMTANSTYLITVK